MKKDKIEYWKCISNEYNKNHYTNNKIYVVINDKIHADDMIIKCSIRMSNSKWELSTEQEYNKQEGIINQSYYFY